MEGEALGAVEHPLNSDMGNGVSPCREVSANAYHYQGRYKTSQVQKGAVRMLEIRALPLERGSAPCWPWSPDPGPPDRPWLSPQVA